MICVYVNYEDEKEMDHVYEIQINNFNYTVDNKLMEINIHENIIMKK